MCNDKTLLYKLKAILTDKHFQVPQDITLEQEIQNAIGTINRCRRFTPTEDKPYDKKYENLIIPMCIYAISKYGAEGETSHSENGISRMYSGGGDYPKELLSQIIPLVK